MRFELFVSGLPYIRLIPKVTAVAGEEFHIKCPVAGYPIEEIRWERGNVIIFLLYYYRFFYIIYFQFSYELLKLLMFRFSSYTLPTHFFLICHTQ